MIFRKALKLLQRAEYTRPIFRGKEMGRFVSQIPENSVHRPQQIVQFRPVRPPEYFPARKTTMKKPFFLLP
jgi:hypothetical protein